MFFFFVFFSWMSNSPEVPNLVCDLGKNQRKLTLNSTRAKSPGTSSEAISPFLAHAAYYFLFYASREPHENICCVNFAHDVWYPKMKTNHTGTKMYFHFRKFIYHWQYPQIKAAIVTVGLLVKRKGCRIEKWTRCRSACSSVVNPVMTMIFVLACISLSLSLPMKYSPHSGVSRTAVVACMQRCGYLQCRWSANLRCG